MNDEDFSTEVSFDGSELVIKVKFLGKNEPPLESYISAVIFTVSDMARQEKVNPKLIAEMLQKNRDRTDKEKAKA